MNKIRNLTKKWVLLLILCTLGNTTFAQETGAIDVVKLQTQQSLQKPLTPEVIIREAQKNNVVKPQTQQFLQKPLTPEDIIKEAHRDVDRAIGILKLVATLIIVLVGLIAMIITMGSAVGFFEFRRWREATFKAETEKYVRDLYEIRNNAENYLDTLRNEIEKTSRLPLTEEDKEVWVNKDVTHDKVGRHDEALKAVDKAIELKPDYADARYNRACVYSMKGEKEKAFSDLKRAIGLDKSYKEKAKKDEDFKNLWEDKDFKRIVE